MSERQKRLEQLPWWDRERVANARCLVVGCGALGNEVLKNLLLLGWGNIIACDFDDIEESNLSRSVLFRQQDVGRPKATSAAEHAAELNPYCRVVPLQGDLKTRIGAGLVARMDVVFGCLDNIEARLYLNTLATSARCLFIDGGLTVWEGTVSLFYQGEAQPCYACGLSEVDLRELSLRHSCPTYAKLAQASAGLPTTAAVASIIAALMVQHGLKWIHGMRTPSHLPIGSQVRFDTAFNRLWQYSLPRRPDCPFHTPPPEVLRHEELHRNHPWRRILDYFQTRLATPDVSLHSSVPILESWHCMVCGQTAQPRRAQSSVVLLLCSRCGSQVIPNFVNQVGEHADWLVESPKDAGLPQLAWMRATTGAGTSCIFEIAGLDPELGSLGLEENQWMKS